MAAHARSGPSPVPPSPDTSPPTRRLFIALWPDGRTRSALRARQALGAWPRGVRLVDAAQLHLTLHYLGAVPESELPRWIRRLKVACTLFDLEGDRYALWPHGIAVWMPAAVPEGLLTLHQRLADRIVAAGHRVDPRPFQPHVTLARRAQAAALPPPRGARGVHWAVRGYALVESCSSAQGVFYRVLHRYRCTPLEPRSPGVFDAYFAHHVAGR